MILPVRMLIKFDRPAGFSVRGWREITRRVFARETLYWYDTFAKRHFAEGAGARYGYKPRTEKYLKRKARKKPGAPLMVYSGRFRNTVLNGHPLLRPYPTRATLVMNTPGYVSMRPPNPTGRRANAPTLGRELTVLSADEYAELNRRMGFDLECEYNRYVARNPGRFA